MPDLHSSSSAYADEETVDTDFLHYLVRGAELLQSGSANEARTMLERALRLRPKNQRGQNLLALSYFKLGLFDRAEELYSALIEEYPDDATLRVNLGLVHLKTGRSDQAIMALLAALERVPDHVKAANYLGLAYAQKRDHTRAKEWFDRAGNAAMSEKMTVAIQLQSTPRLLSAPLPAIETRNMPFAAPPEKEKTGEKTGETRPPGWTSAASVISASEPTMPPPASLAPELAAFSTAHHLELMTGTPYAVLPKMVVISVETELFVRLDGLVAVFGAIEFKPAFKRFRGRVTEKPFGEPGRRMMHAAGKGRLCIAPGDRQFHAIEIGDEPAYFREDSLYAFEESLLFENGRVPSKYSGDLQLIHLRNRGRALITSKNRPRSIQVTKDEPCRVLLDVLLGWHGNITPRIVAIAEEATADGLALGGVELAGEGRVLLDATL